MENNTRSSTNSRPNNGPLPSSGVHNSLKKDNRDLLHPKVKFYIFKIKINLMNILLFRN
jgi:hypothetical protein